VIFEGRDAAGKGGAIKRITETLNPRFTRVVALGTPTDREKGQWYFQRYVAHLPAAGEMVLFDRSWYNRAGVEHVMGFCTDEEHQEFLRSCPEFERMLVRSGVQILKYWFSVSDEEQEKRFQARIASPTKRWKLSPMDLEARSRWVEFSKAKDEMFRHTDIDQAPWWVVHADEKSRARLNCIAHLLASIPYGEPEVTEIVLPPRQGDEGYVRPRWRSSASSPRCTEPRATELSRSRADRRWRRSVAAVTRRHAWTADSRRARRWPVRSTDGSAATRRARSSGSRSRRVRTSRPPSPATGPSCAAGGRRRPRGGRPLPSGAVEDVGSRQLGPETVGQRPSTVRTSRPSAVLVTTVSSTFAGRERRVPRHRVVLAEDLTTSRAGQGVARQVAARPTLVVVALGPGVADRRVGGHDRVVHGAERTCPGTEAESAAPSTATVRLLPGALRLRSAGGRRRSG
jgi:polyphosphate kinase 2